MVVRKLTARVQRWQLLTRYYANKWHYDGSKWAERFWHGERKNPAASIASVPFMITRNMRAQLEQAGFPSQEIASLVPQAAHQLLADKVTYAQYVELREQKEIAEIAAHAAESIKREEEEEAERQHAQAQPQGLVMVAKPAKENDEYHLMEPVPVSARTTAITQLAIVIQEEEKKEQ